MTEHQLSPDKIAEVQEVFSFFDKDGDGAIVMKELGPVLRSLGLNPSEAEIDKLMVEYDADGSGTMEFSEFLTMFPNVKKTGDSFEELEEAFRVFDKEGNCTINPMDLKHIMTNMGEKLTEEEANEMINSADADGDGIHYIDFIKYLLEIQDQ